MSVVIASPGLNPSGPGKAGFPNLARAESDRDACRDECVKQQLDELSAAGIPATIFNGDNGEVAGDVRGFLGFWSFERRWYYWSAKGAGLPVEVAERLHETHGTVCRVAGHCGCPHPREWYKGFGVGDYHIDTPDGLEALADAIRSVYDPDKDPNAKPYCGGGVQAVQDFRSKPK